MNAFEQLSATLLKQSGYWVYPSFKVELTKDEKIAIGRHSTPRWELDLVAYKPTENLVLVVECKSYLDSTGTSMRGFNSPATDRYKLFNDESLRKVVFSRLTKQLTSRGLVLPRPKLKLALMAAKIRKSDSEELSAYFKKNNWLLFGPEWIKSQLNDMANGAYENDVSAIVAKLLLRGS